MEPSENDNVIFQKGDEADANIHDGLWDDAPLIEAYGEMMEKIEIKTAVINPKEDQLKKNDPPKKKVWKIGDCCMAPFDDGRFYLAKIVEMQEKDLCEVCYTEYDSNATVKLSALLGEDDVEWSESADATAIVKEEQITSVDASPVIKASSSVKVSSIVDASPIVKVSPIVNSSPIVKVSPIVNASPTVDASPIVKASPVVKASSIVDTSKIVKAFPTVDASPIVKEEQVSSAPVVVKQEEIVTRVPDIYPPPPAVFDGNALQPDNEKEALNSMLMSWFANGYQTGFYKGMLHGKELASKTGH